MRQITLRIPPEKGTQARGQERILSILQAAHDLFMAEGYHALTMRKVASAAGISVGNLSYYYARKQDLLDDLLDSVVEGYLAEFDKIRTDAGERADRQLEAIIRFIIDDLGRKTTTHFFPELWALANHDRHAAQCLNALYIKARLCLNELLDTLRPDLSAPQRQQLALYISASMEGLTPFVGHRKPWANQRDELGNIAVHALVATVKTIQPRDINPAP